jgi:spermidine synthase
VLEEISGMAQSLRAAESTDAQDGHAPGLPRPFMREELASKSLYFSLEDVQSRMQLQHPDVLDLRYTRTMMAFLLFLPAPSAIAMVGLGGGSLAKFCHRHLPASRIDVVEINPAVIALRDQFGVPPETARFRIIQADGAVFMRDPPQRYGVIMLDAFGPGGLPPEVATQRFYDDCHDSLAPGGVLVANFHSAAADFPLCVARLDRTFPHGVMVVGDGEHINSIVFARSGGPLVNAAASKAIRPHGGSVGAGVRRLVSVAANFPGIAAVARPRVLDATAWAQLSAAFGWVANAARAAQESGVALERRAAS